MIGLMVFFYRIWTKNMLILLTKNILEIGTSNYSTARLIACLENLLTACFEGKHILLLQSTKMISAYKKELSRNAKTTFEQIERFMRTGGGIKIQNKLTCYVQVVEPSQSEITITNKDGKTVIDIPIWYFQDSEATQKTILCCENQHDATFFIHLVKAYLTTEKYLKTTRIKLQATSQGCGGSTIKLELNARCQSRTFCLAIVDNDCNAPNTAFGGTAKSLGLSQTKREEWQNISTRQSDGSITIKKNSALAKALALQEREVENLIPTFLIEKSLPSTAGNHILDKIDTLKKWETNAPREWRKFIDLKKGLRGYNLLHCNNELANKCWLDFMQIVGKKNLKFNNQCKNSNNCEQWKNCECLLWAGLGENILFQVVEYMNKKTPHKIAEFFNFRDDNSLTELAHEILVWCCALEPVRV